MNRLGEAQAAAGTEEKVRAPSWPVTCETPAQTHSDMLGSHLGVRNSGWLRLPFVWLHRRLKIKKTAREKIALRMQGMNIPEQSKVPDKPLDSS